MPQLASGQLIGANFCFQHVSLERVAFPHVGNRPRTPGLIRAVVRA